MTLHIGPGFDQPPFSELCECDDEYGVHRADGSCSRCPCTEFITKVRIDDSAKESDCIACVRRDHSDHINESWCGKTLQTYMWAFTGPSHAAESGRAGNRMIACEKCIEAITTALNRGHV